MSRSLLFCLALALAASPLAATQVSPRPSQRLVVRLDERVLCFDDLAALRAFPVGTTRCVIVRGHSVPGDGGGGEFGYDPAQTALDDGGTILRPDSVGQGAPGRWMRSGVRDGLNVRWFGAVGDAVTDDQPAFAAALAAMSPPTSGTGSILLVPAGVYRLGNTLLLDKQVMLAGVTGLKRAASRLLVDPGITGIHVTHGTTPQGRGSDHTVIRDLRIDAAGKTTPDAHGILLEARATIERCLVAGFSGNGIHIEARVSEGTNANNWTIRNCRSVNNDENGLYVDGGDTNAGLAVELDCSENAGWGVFDSSFLGNTYVACHVASTHPGAGGYRTDSATGRSVFVGCYVEGSLPNELLRPALALGGRITVQNNASTGSVDEGHERTPFTVTSLAGSTQVTTSLGTSGAAKIALGFQSGDDPSPTNLAYDDNSASQTYGWWRLRHSNLDARTSLAISGEHADVGPGNVWLRNGLHLGRGQARRLHDTASAAPKTGTWSRGDVVWNTAPTESGPAGSRYVILGWSCVASGSPGTWVECRTMTGN